MDAIDDIQEEVVPGRTAAFRRLVLEAYDFRCAASRWRIVLPDYSVLVEAAHIVPFGESHDDRPQNGIALTPNFHWAMDKNIIAPGPDLKWHVSKALDDCIRENDPLLELEGRSVLLPKDKLFHPDAESLKWRLNQLLKPVWVAEEDDANDRLRNEENRPKELRTLIDELDKLNEDIRNAHVRLGELNAQISAKQSELEGKDKRRGEILSQMEELEPALKRIAIADRARRILDNFSKQLKQIIAESLEEVVNERFRKIAAEKFQKGKVLLSDNKPPLWKGQNGEALHLVAASGFERRSFSVAFCLALVEITKRSIPLVIDTPIGNADAEYRHRALKALAEFQLTDQIIILTHDAEVSQDFLKAIEDHVNQKMLIEFDPQTGESKIHNHKFFDFSWWETF